jgi:hypothetical protein
VFTLEDDKVVGFLVNDHLFGRISQINDCLIEQLPISFRSKNSKGVTTSTYNTLLLYLSIQNGRVFEGIIVKRSHKVPSCIIITDPRPSRETQQGRSAQHLISVTFNRLRSQKTSSRVAELPCHLIN